MKKLVIFIVGPTAVGKTKTAIDLAKVINAEIISCDSMQVYRGIDILSSKPSTEDLKKVKHHLIDVADASEDYDVARYAKEATQAIEEIFSRDKIPLVVGGTGLYMTVLLDGIFEDNKSNPNLRKNLFQEAQDFGADFLYNKLKELDPEAASKIHPNDVKRIVRALEVCMTHNSKFSEIRTQRQGIAVKYPIKIFGLNMERKILYSRIDQRVDEMISQGAVEEVKNLRQLTLSKTAAVCLGFKEISQFLDKELSLEAAVSLLKKNSRNYAKRQLTRFRRDKRINWIDVTELNTGEIVERFNQSLSE